MNLDKLYPLLPSEDRKTIDGVVVKYLSSMANQFGYSLQEKVKPTQVQIYPIKNKKTRNKGPFYLHGRKFPTISSICMAYGVKRDYVTYRLYSRHMELADIFPKPPPNKYSTK